MQNRAVSMQAALAGPRRHLEKGHLFADGVIEFERPSRRSKWTAEDGADSQMRFSGSLGVCKPISAQE